MDKREIQRQKEFNLRNARVLKHIQDILVSKGFDVEYMDIEKLPEIIFQAVPTRFCRCTTAPNCELHK